MAGWLWLHGMVGLVLHPGVDGWCEAEAYFPAGTRRSSLGALRRRGVRLVAERRVPGRDWLAAWRARARPLRVGRRWWLDPREGSDHPFNPPASFSPSREERGAPARPARTRAERGRILLRIPARTAFGTGSHESTRLVLEILERMDVRGRRVLDVGTGTGVLALAALRLGARRAVAHDLDPAAVFLAAINARLNSAAPRLFAGSLAALREGARFDVALVNVIPEEIAVDLPRLAGLLVPRGRAIFSGILRSRARAALAALRAAGFRRRAARFAGEWAAYVCEAGR